MRYFNLGGHRPSKTNRFRPGMLLAVLMTAMLLLSACGGGDDISATVSVLGNTLTDMNRSQLGEAIAKIADQNPITEEIPIQFMGQEYILQLEDISAEYDVEAIADTAFQAGSQGVLDKVFGSDDIIEIPLSIKYDQSKLEAQAEKAAQALSRGATEFSFEVGQEEVTVIKGGEAAYLDKKGILEGITAKLAAMDYTVFEPESDAQHNQIDFDVLKEAVDRPAQNPKLDLEKDPTGKTVAPGVRGIVMDIAKARAAFEASGDDESFSFPVTFIEPTISVKTFTDNLFRDTLSTVTSSFNASLVGRTTNVKLACDFCDNIILNPGDEFSYNKAVGPRSYERGFKDATVYVAGTTEEGVGGGICQVSSTIYSAVLHADLKISERYNHSYMITYVPLGEDATVVYGSKDFKFVNNTDYPIKLRVTYGKSTMTVSIIGTNLTNKTVEISTKRLSSTPFGVVYQTDETLPVDTTKVKNSGYTGYVTESYRLVYEDGVLVSNTFENKSVYKKLDKLILENPSTPEKSGNYVAPVVDTPDVVPEIPPENPDQPVVPPENPDQPVVQPENPETPVVDPETPGETEAPDESGTEESGDTSEQLPDDGQTEQPDEPSDNGDMQPR